MSGTASLDQISAEQRKVLEIVSAWADRYVCLKTVCIFGSFARGEARDDSDLDLYAVPFDQDELACDHDAAVSSFTQFQADYCYSERSKRELTELTSLPVSTHGGHFRSDDRGEDGAVAFIRDGTIVARLGKVIIVATERKPSKPAVTDT